MLSRRSVILINRRFQLRYALFVCSLLFAASLIYPLTLQYLFDLFIGYVSRDPMGPPLEQIQGTRGEMLALLIAMQALFLAMTFLISIFISHRIAGPIFKLRRAMDEAPAKGFPDIQFRKKDHFHELAQSYSQLMAHLRGRAQSTDDAIRLLEQGDSAQALDLLRKSVARK